MNRKGSPPQQVGFLLLFPLWTFFLLLLLFLWVHQGLAIGLSGVTLLLYLYSLREWMKVKAYGRKKQENLTLKLSRLGENRLPGLPVAILLYDSKGRIEWHNESLMKVVGRDESLIGEELHAILPSMEEMLGEKEEGMIHLGDKWIKVTWRKGDRLIYLLDATGEMRYKERLEKGEKAVALIQLDNIDEATQGMDEQQRAVTLSKIAAMISDWGNGHQMLLRRTASDKFIALMDYEILSRIEQSRFDILDKVRGETGMGRMPFTLSIGVAMEGETYRSLGSMAQEALELALGRGGDQVVVKHGDQLSFYGGKTGAVEKRTRVRARVISHALRDLMMDSEQVLIMGHQMGDFDSIGASIGCARIAAMNHKPAYILLEGKNQAIERLMLLLEEHAEARRLFITPSVAMEMCTPKTLLMIVDTHRASLLVEPALLKKTDRVMVIDHHRRTEEAIEDPLLFYLEPYASSTSELVTELIQYQAKPQSLQDYEATALLAGIIVDTRHFTYRTGVRTFEAASFLRKMGADTGAVQSLLKEDLSMFVARSHLVAGAEILYERVAIATGPEEERYPPLIIAQAADTLLDMEGVEASFVVAGRSDGKVGISARSLGEMNVQMIMEALGGGGHFTNAATQLSNLTIREAKEKLLMVIEKQLGEGSAEG